MLNAALLYQGFVGFQVFAKAPGFFGSKAESCG
jgi:hypothetical protein